MESGATPRIRGATLSAMRSPQGLFTIHLAPAAASRHDGGRRRFRGLRAAHRRRCGHVWKSNPYLSKAFTSEDDALHPQWIIVDLLAPLQINALRSIGASRARAQ